MWMTRYISTGRKVGWHWCNMLWCWELGCLRAIFGLSAYSKVQLILELISRDLLTSSSLRHYSRILFTEQLWLNNSKCNSKSLLCYRHFLIRFHRSRCELRDATRLHVHYSNVCASLNGKCASRSLMCSYSLPFQRSEISVTYWCCRTEQLF